MPVTHIALIKFKPGTSDRTITNAFAELKRLSNVIPQIRGYHAGVNCSPESLSQGLTHAFEMTFATIEDRDIYLEHPAHERVKNMLIELIEDVVVFDFESQGHHLTSRF